MAQVLNDIKKHLEELLEGIFTKWTPGKCVLLLDEGMMEIFDVGKTLANPLLIKGLKLEIF
jgi:hypothetical protein